MFRITSSSLGRDEQALCKQTAFARYNSIAYSISKYDYRPSPCLAEILLTFAMFLISPKCVKLTETISWTKGLVRCLSG
jgi:hypothetical protein